MPRAMYALPVAPDYQVQTTIDTSSLSAPATISEGSESGPDIDFSNVSTQFSGHWTPWPEHLITITRGHARGRSDAWHGHHNRNILYSHRLTSITALSTTCQ